MLSDSTDRKSIHQIHLIGTTEKLSRGKVTRFKKKEIILKITSSFFSMVQIMFAVHCYNAMSNSYHSRVDKVIVFFATLWLSRGLEIVELCFQVELFEKERKSQPTRDKAADG